MVFKCMFVYHLNKYLPQRGTILNALEMVLKGSIWYIVERLVLKCMFSYPS